MITRKNLPHRTWVAALCGVGVYVLWTVVRSSAVGDVAAVTPYEANTPTAQPNDFKATTTIACVLPTLDPWSKEFLSISRPATKPLSCNPHHLPPLTTASGDSLTVTSDALAFRSHGLNASSTRCFYQLITRPQQTLQKFDKDCDNKYSLGDVKKLDLSQGLSAVPTEGVRVWCDDAKKKVSNGSLTRDFNYQNIHFMLPTANVKVKLQTFRKRATTHRAAKMLNFFIIGIDSVSRQNFRRFMPKTFELLSSKKSKVDLELYNKVADNTEPNMSAILNGLDPQGFIHEYKYSCYKSKTASFDDCPFLWKNFSMKGYATFHAEDLPEMAMYHYHKFGFVNQPTDYYARPATLLAEKLLGHSPNPWNRCQGLKFSPEMHLNYASDIMKHVSSKVPTFGLVFSASVTHEDNYELASLDDIYLEFFLNYFENGHSENSVLLFMSDHGNRFGQFRATYQGGIEERMPMMSFIFPDWFKEENPETWKNLKINEKRLTSNYDIHLTIVDLMEGNFNSSSNPKTVSGYGQTLFSEVSSLRTCKEAGIPRTYCVCGEMKSVSTTAPEVIRASSKFISYVNEKLKTKSVCSSLTVEKVMSAHVRTLSNFQSKIARDKSKTKVVEVGHTYSIVLQTQPGSGQFEARLQLTNGEWKVEQEFSRVNRYGNSSHCVQDSHFKLFCYCKQQL